MTEIEPSRRNLIAGVAAAGVALPVLAACGDDGGSDATGAADPTTAGSPGAPSSSGAPQGAIPTSDIPVGGGKIYRDEGVVVTQPTAGQFKAFSATCTHQGCTVSTVSDGTIGCPCHGSKYSIEDGSVQGGPAPKGLPEKNVTISGSSLTVS
ncbi:MAG TPA: Rieske (2Fe-2S) protein [Marmoricola sp.]